MVSDREILEQSRDILQNAFVGLCTTVDSERQPHSRYMGAVVENGDLARLFSLTARGTRKIDHLQKNHAICWVFATPGFEQVVTLKGTAEVDSTIDLPLSAWHGLIELTQPYAMNVLSDQTRHSFASVITSVQTLEFLCPPMGLAAPRIITF